MVTWAVPGPFGVEALLTPFEEDVTGTEAFKAVVHKRFETEGSNPQRPRTTYYYVLDMRTADLPKLGDLKDAVTIRGETTYIRQIADEGQGITRAICG